MWDLLRYPHTKADALKSLGHYCRGILVLLLANCKSFIVPWWPSKGEVEVTFRFQKLEMQVYGLHGKECHPGMVQRELTSVREACVLVCSLRFSRK